MGRTLHTLQTQVFILSTVALSVHHAFANDAEYAHMETVTVYGTTPLTDNSDQIESVIYQRLDSKALDRSQGNTLTDIMDDKLLNVSINDVQNNPFQPDVQYRGFTASPLLGLPQGLSVFFNNTRFNEPFGDTVNWDLLPASAFSSVSLVSGSQPGYGRNTLGGALLLESKNGFNFTQQQLHLNAGNYGQQGVNIETGGHSDNWAYYGNVNYYEEDGWRDHSPTDILQGLGVISHKTNLSETHFTIAGNNNTMIGNGAVPVDLIPYEGRSAVYTQPDQTETQLFLMSLSHEQTLDNDMVLALNLYSRSNEIVTFNGDDSDYEPCDLNGAVTLCFEEEEDDDDDDEHNDTDSDTDEEDELEDAENPVHFVGLAEGAPLPDAWADDAEELDGTINTSRTKNRSYGLTAQLSGEANTGSLQHAWQFGIDWSDSYTHFSSDTEFAILRNDTATDDRGVSGTGLYDNDAVVRLKVDTRHQSVFISDNIALSPAWQLSLAAQYTHDHILMRDQIDEGEGSLNGDHTFVQFNGSAGLIYQSESMNVQMGIAQSSRTPSPAELSCADEDDPCRLPNGFVADPPLEQVEVTTASIDANWYTAYGNISAGVFHSKVANDIIFQQAGGLPSQGYFVNVDETRRQGVELAWQYTFNALSVGINASYLKATFESPFTSFSPQNPLGPDRAVQRGDDIPGQPRQQAALLVSYQLNDHWRIGTDISVTSSQYFRGDEANENRQLSGYGLVDSYISYNSGNGWQASLRIENLFNKTFDTFGTYGEADEVLEDIYDNINSNEFIGVGRPRMLRASVSYTF